MAKRHPPLHFCKCPRDDIPSVVSAAPDRFPYICDKSSDYEAAASRCEIRVVVDAPLCIANYAQPCHMMLARTARMAGL